MHDYYYGAEADQFSFYRIPKELFINDKYKHLSTDAKVLYGLLLNRMDLSARNGWFDDMGRVYIIYTTEEIMEVLNCADNKATKLMNELEEKYGLIERKRQGQGKPNLIYVKNFLTLENSNVDGQQASRFLNRENHDSGNAETTILEPLKARASNTDNNNTDYSDTDPILSGEDDDGMRKRTDYENYFKSALSIDILLHDYPGEEETIIGILDSLVDICCTNRKMIRIAGDDKPAEVVKGRLMKLDSEHIRYVMNCLEENTTNVRNIRQYMLAALYNAPATMSPYYQAKVNYDSSRKVPEEKKTAAYEYPPELFESF
ncbi:MAG: replication initiator protein A [Lachnospiraceae bacterium]|nr:replication initiator protein A [Lachnospiraceae bacterium]